MVPLGNAVPGVQGAAPGIPRPRLVWALISVSPWETVRHGLPEPVCSAHRRLAASDRRGCSRPRTLGDPRGRWQPRPAGGKPRQHAGCPSAPRGVTEPRCGLTAASPSAIHPAGNVSRGKAPLAEFTVTERKPAALGKVCALEMKGRACGVRRVCWGGRGRGGGGAVTGNFGRDPRFSRGASGFAGAYNIKAQPKGRAPCSNERPSRSPLGARGSPAELWDAPASAQCRHSTCRRRKPDASQPRPPAGAQSPC